jgi:adenylosuccinate synthase
LYVAAGCAVDEEILVHELDECGIPLERIVVDPRAVLITDWDRQNEVALTSEIGSTGSGTGSAVIRRMGRTADVRLVKDSHRLRARARIEDVAPLLHDTFDRGEDVIVEGTQGFGLSLFHGAEYPFVTARDTTAAGFAAEVGLSPRQIDEIVLVIRTFPIRVGGRSGRLEEEISWEEIKRISGSPDANQEYTSVTHRMRRVGRFNLQLVQSASRYNRPTALAVMGLDRLNYANSGVTDPDQLSNDARVFLERLQDKLDVPIRWIGTGFGTFDAIIVHTQLEV